jgi:hypothetical protein
MEGVSRERAASLDHGCHSSLRCACLAALVLIEQGGWAFECYVYVELWHVEGPCRLALDEALGLWDIVTGCVVVLANAMSGSLISDKPAT